MPKQASQNRFQLSPQHRPQDDLYAHVCSAWQAANPIPKDKPRWGQFNQLERTVNRQLARIIKDWQAASSLPDDYRQALDFYQVLVDFDKHQAKNRKTFLNLIGLIERLNDTNKARLIGRLTRAGLNFWWLPEVGCDLKNPGRHALYLTQGGLGLPNREYYLSDSPDLVKIRRGYKAFIDSFSREISRHKIKVELASDIILDLETRLASRAWPLKKTRDPSQIHNRHQTTRLNRDFPFAWADYFEELGLARPPREIVIEQPDYLKEVTGWLGDISSADLVSYLKWQACLGYGGYLNAKVAKAKFDFFGRQLLGQQQMTPLPRRALLKVSSSLADTVGRAYVAKHYPDSKNKKLLDLADDLKAAFRERLGRTSWLKPRSRRYAQKKLDQIIVNLGRPKVWQSYAGFNVIKNDALATAVSWARFKTKSSLDRLKERPERRNFGDWGPQTINAWTSPQLLNTNYPAAFLQPPFYDENASLAYNLGALGTVIGHELTHNFDVSGSQFNHRGRLKSWLTKTEQAGLKQAARPLVKAADQWPVAKGVTMDGEQVIGELVADLGGLQIALDVVKKHYDNSGRVEAQKEVFLAYAFYHAINTTSQWRLLAAKADPHPDHIFRVNGVVAHCPEFYQVYRLKKTDGLYRPPGQRATVW